jgi:hypothetical protein
MLQATIGNCHCSSVDVVLCVCHKHVSIALASGSAGGSSDFLLNEAAEPR